MIASQVSPLRYPGGKGKLCPLLQQIVYANGLQGGIYAEPYAGGASSALQLLFLGHVSTALINDADYRIYSFWNAVLNQTTRLKNAIHRTPITVDEWRNQKAIYKSSNKHSQFKTGFASFYLNRCNRSGIIATGGPIGGIAQNGNWKIDARFNKDSLIARIEEIADHKESIKISNLDALDFLAASSKEYANEDFFAYLDPPYFVKGSQLYLNHYKPEDHAKVSDYLRDKADFPWVLTYDDAPEIRALYRDMTCRSFSLHYSAHSSKKGKEVLIAPPTVALP